MNKPAMTLIELAAVLMIVALVIGILVPMLGAWRREARSMQRNTQLRGIHQAMVMHAQDNGGFFPGLQPDPRGVTDDGLDGDLTVEQRFELLLKANYFTGEYAVSPAETRTAWTTGRVTSAHYSYAMLQLPQPGAARRREWRETLNPAAPVLADRNAGTADDVYSVHTEPRLGWRGGVAYNDNHVVIERSHRIPTEFDGIRYPADDLFTAASDDDAYLIHTGSE